MKSNKVFEEIRLTVVGDWIPPQLVGALALQRAEVPEVPVRLTEAQLVGEEPNLVLSTSNRIPPGQSKEAIWFDTLGVALAKRSHLLAYPEVPCSEISPQQVIHAQGIIDAKEPWPAEMRRLFLIAQETSEPAAHEATVRRRESRQAQELALNLLKPLLKHRWRVAWLRCLVALRNVRRVAPGA